MTLKARVRDIEMAYLDEGRRGAPAVVLLHGYPLNHSMWSAQVDALATDYRVITPDLRGHGETWTTAGDDAAGAATMEEMAEDVAALLDALKVERAVVGGLSMGGYVALAFYRLFPGRARALVLADTRAVDDTEESKRGREESARRVLAEGMEAVAETMLGKLLAPATLDEMPDVVARVRGMMRSTDPRGAAAALRGMAARRDQTDLLPDIAVPTLIIVGSEDGLTPRADAEALGRGVRGSRVEVIRGAGHVSNLERPSDFNRVLTDFLSTLEP